MTEKKKKVLILAVVLTGALVCFLLIPAEHSGTCGKDLTWTLSRSGVLTISGSGAMSYESEAPWYPFRSAIKSVVFTGDVTSIENAAFRSCGNLASVTIPGRVTDISFSAFEGCKSLTDVTIPESVKEINNEAFRNCLSLSSVTVLGGPTSRQPDAIRPKYDGIRFWPEEGLCRGNDAVRAPFAAR